MSLFNDFFKSSSESVRKYRADQWNIEFDIPIGWKILFEDRPEPPNYGVFGVVEPRERGTKPSFLLITQIVEDTREGLDAYMNGSERQMVGMFPDFKMLRKEKTTYQDAPSAVMEYTYQGNRGAIQELNMTTFFGERIKLGFQFICEADKRTVTTDRALQRKIIDSIKIGGRGIRVPYLTPTGTAASRCEVCGHSLSEPNALFDGRKPMMCLCDNCWRT